MSAGSAQTGWWGQMGGHSLRDKLRQTIVDAVKGDDKDLSGTTPAPINRSTVLLETRVFKESPLNPTKCCEILSKVLTLLFSGEQLTAMEKTDLFFKVTQLFQSDHPKLRRLVYLLIKTIQASDSEVFIVTSSLAKDMNSTSDVYRANAIRVLSRILDQSLASQMERYIKSAIVDKNPFISSAAILCGHSLLSRSPDVVRRWTNEVAQCTNADKPMVQAHAIAFLYELKAGDRLGLHKLILDLTRKPASNRSPMAEVLLIRFSGQLLMAPDRDASVTRLLLEYIEGCLRHRMEMVTHEAARWMCILAGCDVAGRGGSTIFGVSDVASAVTVLQIFLNSPKPVLKLAALRALNGLAATRPQLVARCNSDMEIFLNEANRSLSTLALTTLLKTGQEGSVDRLMKQITGFIGEIHDNFKVEIVKAVKELCISYPNKHRVFMGFLASQLREEGSAEFKTNLVESLILLSQRVSAAREASLLYLCEFIEDCEYTALCSRILSFIADEAPQSKITSKVIRFIYNRLILENAIVRVAAVDALTRIANRCPLLRVDILILLECVLYDNDDEVRDRSNLYYRFIQKSVDFHQIDEGDSDGSTTASLETLLDPLMPFSVDAICERCEAALTSNEMKLVDLVDLPNEQAFTARQSVVVSPPITTAERLTLVPTGNVDFLSRIHVIVPPAKLGHLIHSSCPQSVTETEAEYPVEVTKHFFKDSNIVVLEFRVSNTMADQSLENVTVKLGIRDGEWSALGGLSIESLKFEQSRCAYVVLEHSKSKSFCPGSFSAQLSYTLKEIGDDFGYEDVYSVDPVVLGVGDFCSPRKLRVGEFRGIWADLGGGCEETTKLSFGSQFKGLSETVAFLMRTLKLAACEESDVVSKDVTSHALLLNGLFGGEHHVALRVMLVDNAQIGIAMKLVVRSSCAEAATAISSSFESTIV